MGVVSTINQKALQYAAKLIECSIDTLDDMPTELANTIANIYYKFALLSIESEEMPFPFGKAPGRDSREKMNNYVEYSIKVKAEFEAVPKFVQVLRECKKNNSPEYDGILHFVLDNLKYNIKNATFKSLIVRKMERPFKKVDEIEGLVDLMKF